MASQNAPAAAGPGATDPGIRPLERMLRTACIALLVCLAAATLAAAATVVAAVAWPQSGTASPPIQSGHGANTNPGAGASANGQIDAAVAAARKELEARIDKEQKEAIDRVNERLDSVKTILASLVTLVGLYSVIVAVTAFVTVKYARDDAKETINSLREYATAQITYLKEKIVEIQQEFPEFGSLHERMESLVREMQGSMRSEADWNDDETFKALSEEERQGILHNEVAFAAISVFALDRSATMRSRLPAIYSAFARFYLGRHNTAAEGNDGDYERAQYYASIAVRESDYSAGALRLRGAIYLARYDRLSNATPPPGADKLNDLLSKAQKTLSEAIQKDTAESVDAGAHYNLAVAQNYAGKRADAVKTLRNLIRLRGKLSWVHREKYLPYIYQNLACYLALQAAEVAATDATKAAELSTEAVAAAKDGVAEFQPPEDKPQLKALLSAIRDELKPGKDLAVLEQSYQDQLHLLGQPPPPPPPAGQAPVQP